MHTQITKHNKVIQEKDELKTFYYILVQGEILLVAVSISYLSLTLYCKTKEHDN